MTMMKAISGIAGFAFFVCPSKLRTRVASEIWYVAACVLTYIPVPLEQCPTCEVEVGT